MWDSPRQLDLFALLFALAAAAMIAWGTVAWTVRQPAFALHRVVVEGNLARASRAHLERVIREELKGTFFTLSLADARASLQRVPWVKSVALRRQWPDRLEVTIAEHDPLARWNDTGLVDTEGQVFNADFDGELPQFVGPDGSSAEIAQRYREFGLALEPRSLAIAQVRLSPRGGWQLRTTGGAALAIELGRSAPVDRLSRFVRYHARTVGALNRGGTRVDYVDLRYRNGFAVRVPGFTERPPRKAG
ncbi:MAG: cell division protein FtsQ/DivIB [Pseudomonadota bacterium]|nr:cell division protein FtsQ/DivIB [Pseudomonadota bacterium]